MSGQGYDSLVLQVVGLWFLQRADALNFKAVCTSCSQQSQGDTIPSLRKAAYFKARDFRLPSQVSFVQLWNLHVVSKSGILIRLNLLLTTFQTWIFILISRTALLQPHLLQQLTDTLLLDLL